MHIHEDVARLEMTLSFFGISWLLVVVVVGYWFSSFYWNVCVKMLYCNFDF